MDYVYATIMLSCWTGTLNLALVTSREWFFSYIFILYTNLDKIKNPIVINISKSSFDVKWTDI